MDFLFKDPPLEGNECPTCGKKTWWIMKCDKCGKVFCKYCNPKAFDFGDPEYDDAVEVTCSCGKVALFV